MSRLLAVTVAVLALAACKKEEAAAPAPPPADSFDIVGGFLTPESVLHDSVTDVYLVSNINGAPTEKDDNGFISQVATDGRVIALKWIDGASDSVTLNAPKGLGIRGDTVFVADIDEVRLFDRISGRSLGSWRVRGATFLNDVAVGPDGTVYVTDTGFNPDFSPNGSDAVYRFDARGRPRAVVRGQDLGGPNGVLATDSGLVVVGWNGDMYSIVGRQRSPIVGNGRRQLDGVVRAADGALIVSTWADSTVTRRAPGATEWTDVATGVESPADIGIDLRRNRLLIPQFSGNRVLVRPLP